MSWAFASALLTESVFPFLNCLHLGRSEARRSHCPPPRAPLLSHRGLIWHRLMKLKKQIWQKWTAVSGGGSNDPASRIESKTTYLWVQLNHYYTQLEIIYHIRRFYTEKLISCFFFFFFLSLKCPVGLYSVGIKKLDLNNNSWSDCSLHNFCYRFPNWIQM